MRSDDELNLRRRTFDKANIELIRVDNRLIADGASFSGHERNRLFINNVNTPDGGFVDLSGISGLDSPADGRSFAILDIDQDGWVDLLVANANEPRTMLLRNRLGDARSADNQTGFFAVRLVGGQQTSKPSSQWSNRDGYGALIEVELGDRRLIREHRAGEGLAAQNSATILIGMDGRARADNLRITWPSGREQTLPGPSAGELVTVYEDPTQSPTGTSLVSAPYVRGPRFPRQGDSLISKLNRPKIEFSGVPRSSTASILYMYTTMATWCVSCRQELSQLREVRRAISETQLAMLAVAYDENETPEQIDLWMNANSPPYDLIGEATRTEVDHLKTVVESVLGVDGPPSTVITNVQGEVLAVRWGSPSVSEVRKLLLGISAQVQPGE